MTGNTKGGSSPRTVHTMHRRWLLITGIYCGIALGLALNRLLPWEWWAATAVVATIAMSFALARLIVWAERADAVPTVERPSAARGRLRPVRPSIRPVGRSRRR